jgi:hypothetical protein
MAIINASATGLRAIMAVINHTDSCNYVDYRWLWAIATIINTSFGQIWQFVTSQNPKQLRFGHCKLEKRCPAIDKL